MFIRFFLVILIFTLVHGVNTQTNTTTSPPANATSTPTPPSTPTPTATTTPTPTSNVTAAPPNATASPTTTPSPVLLCPAFNASIHQQLYITDPSGILSSPFTSIPASSNNTRITISCDTGYIMTRGQGITIKCNSTHWLSLDDGKEWISSTTPCQPIATIPPQKVCPRFPKLDQQTVKLIRNSPFIPNELYPLGEQLNTTCAPGYRKTTQDYVIVTCIEQDGVMKWDGKGIETCFDIDCGPVTPPPHGRFAEPPPAELHVNTSIRIICDEGYHVIRGAGDVDDVITCIGTTGDASWDQAIPICTEDDVINNNNNTIDRNLTGTNEITNNDKAKRVAGGVIGGILGLAIIIICIYCLCAQHARTGRWINLGSNEPKHDGEELQNMNVMRGSADEDV